MPNATPHRSAASTLSAGPASTRMLLFVRSMAARLRLHALRALHLLLSAQASRHEANGWRTNLSGPWTIATYALLGLAAWGLPHALPLLGLPPHPQLGYAPHTTMLLICGFLASLFSFMNRDNQPIDEAACRERLSSLRRRIERGEIQISAGFARGPRASPKRL